MGNGGWRPARRNEVRGGEENLRASSRHERFADVRHDRHSLESWRP